MGIMPYLDHVFNIFNNLVNNFICMVNIKKYPDGSSYASIPLRADIAQRESVFNYRINSYEDLWHLGQILEAFNYKRIDPHVTIPCLLDAQADKRFDKNDTQSSGLKMVCKFLNQFNALYSIYHPHNPEVVEAHLKKKVNISDNSQFITEVLQKIDGHEEQTEYGTALYMNNKIYDELILMSSDAGGFKPLMKLCDKIQWKGTTESASKSREFIDGKSKLIQKVDRQDFEGKDILIVDDICVGGGTFIGLAKILKERNIGKLYLAVSHMTVQNLNPELFEAYDNVFTTNSKYNDYFIPNSKGEPITPINLTINKYF